MWTTLIIDNWYGVNEVYFNILAFILQYHVAVKRLSYGSQDKMIMLSISIIAQIQP